MSGRPGRPWDSPPNRGTLPRHTDRQIPLCFSVYWVSAERIWVEFLIWVLRILGKLLGNFSVNYSATFSRKFFSLAISRASGLSKKYHAHTLKYRRKISFWPGKASRTKNQPKEEVFGTDIPRTSGGHSRGYPGQKLRSGRSKSWKNKHFGTDIHDPKARTSMTLRDFRKLRSEKLWAEFSFPNLAELDTLS